MSFRDFPETNHPLSETTDIHSGPQHADQSGHAKRTRNPSQQIYNGAGMFGRNGTTVNLEGAMAALLHNQAQFVAHLDEDRQRFSRIERDLELIKALLIKHEETLQKLPDAIKDKIGFNKQ
jgi:hypothetical protein